MLSFFLIFFLVFFSLSFLHLTTLGNDHGLHGSIILRTHVFDLFDDIETFDHFAKDDVFPIEMGSGNRRDEELAAVGVWSGIL